MKRWKLFVNRSVAITYLLFIFSLAANASVLSESERTLTIKSDDVKFKPCSSNQGFWGCPDDFSAHILESINIRVKAINGTFNNVHLEAVVDNFLNQDFIIQPPTSCSKLGNNQICTFTLTAQLCQPPATSSVVHVVANNKIYLSFTLTNLCTF